MSAVANGLYVWVVRDIEEEERGGILLSANAIQKPTRGTIYSVGSLVTDEFIKSGRKAIFHKQSGGDIEYAGATYVILRDDQILGTDD
jgi:co-chaperonin GroES (HSP10)